jgi:chromosome partitioning protein
VSRIIFTNQKGGVGKTTLTREVGITLSELGMRVLLVDCDPQGNLSKSFEVEASGLYDGLTGGEAIVHHINNRLALLPGNLSLSLLEKRSWARSMPMRRLRDLLDTEEFSVYDFILLDTPPSLGILTINALGAADHVVIPMSPSLYSMQGTNDLMASVAKVRKGLNPSINLLGVIINAYDSVPVITREIREEIRENFAEKLFTYHLSRSIRVEEVIIRGEGLAQQKGREYAKAREEILAITKELLNRIEASYVLG